MKDFRDAQAAMNPRGPSTASWPQQLFYFGLAWSAYLATGLVYITRRLLSVKFKKRLSYSERVLRYMEPSLRRIYSEDGFKSSSDDLDKLEQYARHKSQIHDYHLPKGVTIKMKVDPEYKEKEEQNEGQSKKR